MTKPKLDCETVDTLVDSLSEDISALTPEELALEIVADYGSPDFLADEFVAIIKPVLQRRVAPIKLIS